MCIILLYIPSRHLKLSIKIIYLLLACFGLLIFYVFLQSLLKVLIFHFLHVLFLVFDVESKKVDL